MTDAGRSRQQAETPVLVPVEQRSLQLDGADLEIQRIQRIGKRLFGVAECVVAVGDARRDIGAGQEPISAEAAFCYSVPLSGVPIVVADMLGHRALSRHPAVQGAPHIRFYAAHPIFGQDRAPIGSISLIDHAPRRFCESDGRMLADLAVLVERELQLRSANASQLDLQKKNKSLRRRSLIDPMIGIWNRGAIMRILSIEATRCDKAGVPLSLIVADLDYFKRINDNFGHPAGDSVLVKVASRLRCCIRPQEALGRYGGEEFLIVLPGSSSVTAMAVAERMRREVAAQPETIGGTTLNLTISAGVASTDTFASASTEELISRADVALYAAKDAGRNCVMRAVPELS